MKTYQPIGNEVDKLVGRRVRAIRTDRCLDLVMVAQRCGVSVPRYRACEAGTQRFSAADIFELVKIFQISVADIYVDVRANIHTQSKGNILD